MIPTDEPRVTWNLSGGGRLAFVRHRLRVVEGPDMGRAAAFSDDRLRIGVKPGSELELTDPFVSGLHAELQPGPEGVRLRDLGSTNGTWIGDVQIHDVVIHAGVTLRVGKTRLFLEAEGGTAELPLAAEARFGPLHGASLKMRELFTRLARIAPAEVPVLITGETGCGKEMAARAIHEASPRAAEPFVAVECGAIPATLIESELFGFDKGAFTSADRNHRGAFERAGGGTVFLDEVGELPLEVQPKLLRALDQLEFRRLGSEQRRPIRARILAATNRDLPRMVNEGTFRDDLYYRLAVAEVHLPPLRDRRDDIPLLVERLMEALPPDRRVQVPAETMKLLIDHEWPGNVRELRNAVQRIALVGEPPVGASRATPVAAGAAPAPAGTSAPPPTGQATLTVDLRLPYKEARDQLLEEFRALYGRDLLARASGSISGAARLARVDRMTLYRLLRKDDEAE